MQNTITAANAIEQLIKTTYQRMMAFEQAAFLSDNSSLKTFYQSKADESEQHLKELYAYMQVSETEGEKIASEPATSSPQNLLQALTGKKTAIKILETVQLIEKSVMAWYKTFIRDVQSVPQEFEAMIKRHYDLLALSQMQLKLL